MSRHRPANKKVMRDVRLRERMMNSPLEVRELHLRGL
jgi:hypothetical protein